MPLKVKKLTPAGAAMFGRAQLRAQKRQPLAEEAQILAHGQQPQVQHSGEHDRKPAPPPGQQTQQPVDKRRDDEQGHGPELSEGVKHQPRGAEKDVFCPHRRMTASRMSSSGRKKNRKVGLSKLIETAPRRHSSTERP